MEDNNINAPLQKFVRGYGWFTAYEISGTNDSITFLNFDKITLNTECNACSIISIPVIERTFSDYYTHILHGISEGYMYGYLISKSIGSEATNHNII